MKSLIDIKKLNQIIGDYRTGKEAEAVKDPEILRQVRMRRRQLGRMMTALDRDAAKYRIPAGDYFISRKIDGEFTCLVYRNGKAFTINPGGTVRVGAAFHNEAAKKTERSRDKISFNWWRVIR